MPQQINFPYGNAFLVATPHIDQLTQQLYAEQKNRELLRQKQAAALDDEFSKNVAGIKDVDVPELTKLYGDWKTANIQSMKNPKGVSPEQQLELLRKKAEMYKFINSSKQDLAESEMIGKEYYKSPDQFDDNTPTYLAVRRKTPTSQLGGYKDANGNPINLQDGNTYKYKGTNTDFSKIERDSAGTPRQVYQEESALDGGLQTKITPYMYGNTPTQFYQNYLGSLALRKAGRDAEALASQIKPEMYESVQKEYNSIPADVWKKMGVDKPQELMISPDDSKAEKLAKHQAQLYALNNQPKQGTPVFRDNKAAIDARNFDQQKQMAAINDQYARGRLAMQQQYKKDFLAYKGAQTKKEADSILEGYINRSFEEGKESKMPVIGVKGEWVRGRNITVPKEITDKYTISKGNSDEKIPTKFIMSEDKKYVVPVYGNENTVDKRNHIPIELFRNDLAKIWLSKKDAAAEIGDDLDFGDDGEEEVDGGGSLVPATQSAAPKFPLPKGKPQTVKQGGYSYEYDPNTGKYH